MAAQTARRVQARPASFVSMDVMTVHAGQIVALLEAFALSEQDGVVGMGPKRFILEDHVPIQRLSRDIGEGGSKSTAFTGVALRA